LDRHVRFLSGDKGTITSIDTANRSVSTADGTVHRYDHLVISTGSHLQFNEIPVLAEGADTFFNLEKAKDM